MNDIVTQMDEMPATEEAMRDCNSESSWGGKQLCLAVADAASTLTSNVTMLQNRNMQLPPTPSNAN